MTCERTFTAKTVHTENNKDGTWSIHVRTQDDYRFEFRCGQSQAKMVENVIDDDKRAG